MSKYGNKRTTVDGISFDSKLEASRYCELKLLERAGEIHSLQLQPAFELVPAFTKFGKRYRAVKYVADFAYYDKDGVYTVEDTKGFRTAVYALKRKLFDYRYPTIIFKEVTK